MLVTVEVEVLVVVVVLRLLVTYAFVNGILTYVVVAVDVLVGAVEVDVHVSVILSAIPTYGSGRSNILVPAGGVHVVVGVFVHVQALSRHQRSGMENTCTNTYEWCVTVTGVWLVVVTLQDFVVYSVVQLLELEYAPHENAWPGTARSSANRSIA